jgi:hypothetical protein
MSEQVGVIDELIAQVMGTGEDQAPAARPRQESGRRRRPGSLLGALGRLFSRSGGAG